MRIRTRKTLVRDITLGSFYFYIEESLDLGKVTFAIKLRGEGTLGSLTAPIENSEARKKARELAFYRSENLAKFALMDKSYDLYDSLQVDQAIIDSY